MFQAVLLVAEDNPDDRLLIEHAWSDQTNVQLFLVEDGKALMDFLQHQGKYAQEAMFPAPNLIWLDLRMPRKNGFEVLAELKAHPVWKRIPVIVVTTSNHASDIDRAYDLGASAFFSKPQTFEEFLNLVAILYQYWFATVSLPTAVAWVPPLTEGNC